MRKKGAIVSVILLHLVFNLGHNVVCEKV